MRAFNEKIVSFLNVDAIINFNVFDTKKYISSSTDLIYLGTMKAMIMMMLTCWHLYKIGSILQITFLNTFIISDFIYIFS